jgi:uncharacterized integral membrane protein (TIGR00698 family)
MMQQAKSTSRGVNIAIAVALLVPLAWYGNPAIALFAGIALSLARNAPLDLGGHRLGRLSLQSAIVLLGLTLNIARVVQVSGDSLWIVVTYVLSVMAIGLLLARLLRLEHPSGLLMSAGTAICGGTAIATLAPIVNARADQLGVAIGIVFVLNAIALFSFPPIGHALALTQQQFGVWSALAIHDTSSVLATAAIYGDEALQVATTVKLSRTLWLIPLALTVSLYSSPTTARLRIPTFILAFLAASAFGSVVALPAELLHIVARLSKALLVAALFFIGTEISWTTLRQMRGPVLVQAVLLWLMATLAVLAAVLAVF